MTIICQVYDCVHNDNDSCTSDPNITLVNADYHWVFLCDEMSFGLEQGESKE